ncbi:MAG: hypothetical protein ACR2FU_08290 [Streptosporangiaceae bacterium]
MSDAPPAPSWRILVSPRWISWHLFAVAAVAGMTLLGDWQFRRAMAGNTLSWAYTFEWPIFAVFGVVFWIKTIRDELHPATSDDGQVPRVTLPSGSYAEPAGVAAGGAGGGGDDLGPAGEPDQELAEYNAYLAKLSNEIKGHGRWHGLR